MPSWATLLVAAPAALPLASSNVMNRTSGDLSCPIPCVVISKAPQVKLRKVRIADAVLNIIVLLLELLRRCGVRRGLFEFLLQQMSGAFFVGLHVAPEYMRYFQAPVCFLVSAMHPKLPGEPACISAQHDPYFCLADSVLLLEAVLRSVGEGRSSRVSPAERVGFGTGESRGCGVVVR